MSYELVIRGGTVIDGTGAAGVRADVAVSGGRIVAIGDELRGDRELDATGHVVAPGFIDVHTHYDAQVFWDPDLTPSAFHGVTTVVAGNCGFSIAPVRSEGVGILGRTLQHVEDMSLDTLTVGVPWSEFESFGDYLDAVERRGVGLNYGCYVGHTALRLYVMGDDAYERAATPDELDEMQRLVAEAMDAGAIGFATSASPTHNGDRGRPVPSRQADLDEVRFLCEPLRERGRGVVAMLPGGVFRNEQLFELQRHLGRPITWTALLTVKGLPYHEKVVAEHDAARAEGVAVWPQVSCRPLVFQMNMEEPFTLNMRPSFAALMDADRAVRVAAYRDPVWRAEAWSDVSGGGGLLPFNWPALTIAESQHHPELVGRAVVDLAEE
ncbi:MAG: N-acyl-D-amino-acid deacylase family protein, partial [Actinomycetes bacterium]